MRTEYTIKETLTEHDKEALEFDLSSEVGLTQELALAPRHRLFSTIIYWKKFSDEKSEEVRTLLKKISELEKKNEKN